MINDRFYSSAAAAAGSGDMSIIGLISSADMVSKLVFFILVLISFISWGIIFEKYRLFKNIRLSIKSFEKKFYSGEELDNLYKRAKKQEDRALNPLAGILISAVEEWYYLKKADKQGSAMCSGAKERIAKALELKLSRQVDKLTSNLNFLATAGSVSPFIGLFGTVWGIMHSFQSIAYSRNTNLSIVAPGIAEALLATAIGLLVAIPAVIAYNHLTNRANKLLKRFDEFSEELYGVLSRTIDHTNNNNN